MLKATRTPEGFSEVERQGVKLNFGKAPCGGVSTKGSSGAPGESLEMLSTVTGFAAFYCLFRPFCWAPLAQCLILGTGAGTLKFLQRPLERGGAVGLGAIL